MKNIKFMCKINLSKSKKEIKGAHKKMQKLKTVDTLRERERERELYSNKIIKLEAIIASNCDSKIKQAIIA